MCLNVVGDSRQWFVVGGATKPVERFVEPYSSFPHEAIYQTNIYETDSHSSSSLRRVAPPTHDMTSSSSHHSTFRSPARQPYHPSLGPCLEQRAPRQACSGAERDAPLHYSVNRPDLIEHDNQDIRQVAYPKSYPGQVPGRHGDILQRAKSPALFYLPPPTVDPSSVGAYLSDTRHQFPAHSSALKNGIQQMNDYVARRIECDDVSAASYNSEVDNYDFYAELEQGIYYSPHWRLECS